MDIGLIKDGVVENVICADSVESTQEHYPNHTCVERAPGVVFGPGWTYDGKTFAPPEESTDAL